MSAPLTVHNAQISTAAIEVRTLTISKRQVTLAVFRQLQEEPFVNEDGTTNGIPWGTVNYHPDKCGGEEKHWHVVWQSGDQLRRSRVWVDPLCQRFASEAGNQWFTAHVLETIDQECSLHNADIIRSHYNMNGRRVVERSSLITSPGLRCEVTMSDKALIAIRRASGSNHGVLSSCMTDELRALAAECTDWLPEGELLDIFDSEVQEAAIRHRDVRQAIADLPQLFIAV